MKVLEGRINNKKYLWILDECLWPTVQRYFAGGGYIFQEDNAPTHKANLVKRYFYEKNTAPTLWPMYSPDLSPIDNCWSLVKMRLKKEIHNKKNSVSPFLATFLPNSINYLSVTSLENTLAIRWGQYFSPGR